MNSTKKIRNDQRRKAHSMMVDIVDDNARQTFQRPIMTARSRMTALAAVKIIENHLDRLDPNDMDAVMDIAGRILNQEG